MLKCLVKWCLGANFVLYEQETIISLYTAVNKTHCEHNMTLCNDLHEFTGFEHDCSNLV